MYSAQSVLIFQMFQIVAVLKVFLFQCEATNGEEKVESTAVVRVNLGSFGTLPKNFPAAPVDFSGKLH
jgi:hypothetical protein